MTKRRQPPTRKPRRLRHSDAEIGPSDQERDRDSMRNAKSKDGRRSPETSLETKEGSQPSLRDSAACDTPKDNNQALNRLVARDTPDLEDAEPMTNSMTAAIEPSKRAGDTLEQLYDFETWLRSGARFARLLNELKEEFGGAHGWKKQVAELLGVSPGYISRISSGERMTVGGLAIAKAMERLSIDRAYFFGEEEPKSYLDYQKKPGKTRTPALETFLTQQLGRTTTEEELHILESLDFGDAQPTPSTYHSVLVALRSFPPKRPSDAARNRATAEETDRLMEAERRRKND